MTIWRASEALAGKEVVTSDGRDLGTLKDLEVDHDGWGVTGLVVKLNRDVLDHLHLKKPLMGSQDLVIASAHVAGVSDKIVLKKSLAQLGQLAGAQDARDEDARDAREPQEAQDEDAPKTDDEPQTS